MFACWRGDAFGLPLRDETLGQSRAPDGEERSVLGLCQRSFPVMAREASSRPSKSTATAPCARLRRATYLHPIEVQYVDQADTHWRLPARCLRRFGFGHGCHGMAAHRGVFVDAIDLASASGEEISEDNIAAEMGCTNDDGDEVRCEDVTAHLHCPADAAMGGGTVEG